MNFHKEIPEDVAQKPSTKSTSLFFFADGSVAIRTLHQAVPCSLSFSVTVMVVSVVVEQPPALDVDIVRTSAEDPVGMITDLVSKLLYVCQFFFLFFFEK